MISTREIGVTDDEDDEDDEDDDISGLIVSLL